MDAWSEMRGAELPHEQNKDDKGYNSRELSLLKSADVASADFEVVDLEGCPSAQMGGRTLPPLPLPERWLEEWRQPRPFERAVVLRAERGGANITPSEEQLVIPPECVIDLEDLVIFAGDYGWPDRPLLLLLYSRATEGVLAGADTRILAQKWCPTPMRGPRVAQQDASHLKAPDPDQAAPRKSDGLDGVAVIAEMIRRQREDSLFGVVEDALADPDRMRERIAQLKDLGSLVGGWGQLALEVGVPMVRAAWDKAAQAPEPAPRPPVASLPPSPPTPAPTTTREAPDAVQHDRPEVERVQEGGSRSGAPRGGGPPHTAPPEGHRGGGRVDRRRKKERKAGVHRRRR